MENPPYEVGRQRVLQSGTVIVLPIFNPPDSFIIAGKALANLFLIKAHCCIVITQMQAFTPAVKAQEAAALVS